jgi:hypothetical protein
MTTELLGEDGLTAAERMALFDSLPKAIRNVLAAAPYNYDIRDIRDAWENFKFEGWSPQRAARHFQKDFIEQARLTGSLPVA